MRSLTLLLAAAVVCSGVAASAQPAGRTRDGAPAQTRPLRDPAGDRTLSSAALARRPVVATSRLGRTVGEDAGGACRLRCAAEHHQCRASDELSTCATGWTRCVTACSTAATGR